MVKSVMVDTKDGRINHLSSKVQDLENEVAELRAKLTRVYTKNVLMESYLVLIREVVPSTRDSSVKLGMIDGYAQLAIIRGATPLETLKKDLVDVEQPNIQT